MIEALKHIHEMGFVHMDVKVSGWVVSDVLVVCGGGVSDS